MQCREAERLADLSLDGEVAPHEQTELDAHLLECAPCRSRTAAHRWVHGSIRAKLQTSSDNAEAPAHLRSRVSTELRAAQREVGGFGWRLAFPMAMALAVVSILSWTRSTAPALAPDEAVVHHTRNIQPQIRAHGSVRKVEQFVEQKLGWPMPVPLPTDRNLRLVGARMSNLGADPTVQFMFDHRGARVSVFANEKHGALAAPANFERRLVHGHPMYVGHHRGYTVVATERGDVLYRFVSDLDGAELVRFASSMHR